MKDDMGLSQVIYNILKTQIQFGAYRHGDTLPTMENASSNFDVALATIRFAYLQLQQEGYITLSTNVGSVVSTDYSESEIECCIQNFFSRRKEALIDLSKSIRLLLGHIQWIGIKHAPVEIFSEMLMFKNADVLQPYFAFNHIMGVYGSLKNELLRRLLWQIFMFFEAPFFSIRENAWRLFTLKEYAPLTLNYCLTQDWESLQKAIYTSQDFLSLTLCQFYENRITTPSPQQEIAFTWSPYKKASQICYSLAMELLVSINRGEYAAHTRLPSLKEMSKEKNVSMSTVRRTYSLLNGVGATISKKRVGTSVLPLEESYTKSDFKKPTVRKRLLDVAESLQILTLSCKAVAEATISSLDAADLQKCKEHLSLLETRRQYHLVTYAALELLEQFAPYQAIRTVYTQLMQQLFWGFSLRSIWRDDNDRADFYSSYFQALMRSLENTDAARFSEELEQLMIHEFNFSVKILGSLGIKEAERLLMDDMIIEGAVK